MKGFAYLTPKNLEAASKALKKSDNGMAKGAGTDLLDLMKERVVEPDEIVNLLQVESPRKDGELGALTTLADVAADPWIRTNFPALATAAGEAATPQVRNVATVGGNLCQHTRCWYFRNKNFECFKRGFGDCSAVLDGAHNRYHAIFPHGHCASAYPGNLAPALIAVGAKVACVHPSGERTMDVELMYDEPQRGKKSDTILRSGELVRAVILEPSAMSKNSTYVEFRERLSFDFAVASVAVALDGKNARIVCGGVAATPYRARAAEKAVAAGKGPADVAAAAVEGAQPLAQNKYKVVILKRLVRQALEELTR